LFSKKRLFKKTPEHEFFINKNTTWLDSDMVDYRKKFGKNENDTMVILTKDKLILITGQYGLLPNDTIIMPSSGEFGINYEVLENNKYRLSHDTLITISEQRFLKRSDVKFEWWNEIIRRIKGLGKGKIIVSSP
jgi:hypothetical protein